jgi:hypothetical protein
MRWVGTMTKSGLKEIKTIVIISYKRYAGRPRRFGP